MATDTRLGDSRAQSTPDTLGESSPAAAMASRGFPPRWCAFPAPTAGRHVRTPPPSTRRSPRRRAPGALVGGLASPPRPATGAARPDPVARLHCRPVRP